MATVKELEGLVTEIMLRVEKAEQNTPTLAQFVELKQLFNGLSMSFEKHVNTYQADLLAIRQKLGLYYVNAQARETKKQPPKEHVADRPPWWIPLVEFKNWLVGVKQDEENQRVANALNRHLKSAARYGEGQLYIEWRQRVTEEECLAFWQDAGFDGIPDGL